MNSITDSLAWVLHPDGCEGTLWTHMIRSAHSSTCGDGDPSRTITSGSQRIPGRRYAMRAILCLSVGLLVLASVLSFALSVGIAATIVASPGAETRKIGAHLFTWGMSYAYAQAYRDVKAKTWFGE